MELYGYRMGTWPHNRETWKGSSQDYGQDGEGEEGKDWHDLDSHLDREDQGYSAYGKTQEEGQNWQAHIVFGGLFRKISSTWGQRVGYSLVWLWALPFLLAFPFSH